MIYYNRPNLFNITTVLFFETFFRFRSLLTSAYLVFGEIIF